MTEKKKEVGGRLDGSVTEYEKEGVVELKKYPPAGEDFIVSVDTGDFVENVKAYAANFDQDEHIEMWVEAKHNGGRGIPSIRELVQDAADIDKMLQELAIALQEAEDREGVA